MLVDVLIIQIPIVASKADFSTSKSNIRCVSDKLVHKNNTGFALHLRLDNKIKKPIVITQHLRRFKR